tara:strand:- start:5137 stop:7212 length:2076 start_codon:yes stop_codon:yes gene_type:complete
VIFLLLKAVLTQAEVDSETKRVKEETKKIKLLLENTEFTTKPLNKEFESIKVLGDLPKELEFILDLIKARTQVSPADRMGIQLTDFEKYKKSKKEVDDFEDDINSEYSYYLRAEKNKDVESSKDAMLDMKRGSKSLVKAVKDLNKVFIDLFSEASTEYTRNEIEQVKSHTVREDKKEESKDKGIDSKGSIRDLYYGGIGLEYTRVMNNLNRLFSESPNASLALKELDDYLNREIESKKVTGPKKFNQKGGYKTKDAQFENHNEQVEIRLKSINKYSSNNTKDAIARLVSLFNIGNLEEIKDKLQVKTSTLTQHKKIADIMTNKNKWSVSVPESTKKEKKNLNIADYLKRALTQPEIVRRADSLKVGRAIDTILTEEDIKIKSRSRYFQQLIKKKDLFRFKDFTNGEVKPKGTTTKTILRESNVSEYGTDHEGFDDLKKFAETIRKELMTKVDGNLTFQDYILDHINNRGITVITSQRQKLIDKLGKKSVHNKVETARKVIELTKNKPLIKKYGLKRLHRRISTDYTILQEILEEESKENEKATPAVFEKIDDFEELVVTLLYDIVDEYFISDSVLARTVYFEEDSFSKFIYDGLVKEGKIISDNLPFITSNMNAKLEKSILEQYREKKKPEKPEKPEKEESLENLIEGYSRDLFEDGKVGLPFKDDDREGIDRVTEETITQLREERRKRNE